METQADEISIEENPESPVIVNPSLTDKQMIWEAITYGISAIIFIIVFFIGIRIFQEFILKPILDPILDSIFSTLENIWSRLFN
tara:strand:+ start:51917 stop:52168 length:252 start_codon:yes stop_codon:yes gene_type:complete